ncbi:MAG: hypothetical protein KJZ83_02465 [Burkholderiaceae bacterium]|nr:hypothetical protein [Burkholderiaceae bacterium]
MGITSFLRGLLTPAMIQATAKAPAATGAASLDGKSFKGVVLEPGKTSGDADTLVFKNGRFHSSACEQYGYRDGPYTVSSAGGVLSFTAQTESPKYGRLDWNCVVRGRKLDGTLTMYSDGRPSGEKWVVAGEQG